MDFVTTQKEGFEIVTVAADRIDAAVAINF
jgi:hypothetical protein